MPSDLQCFVWVWLPGAAEPVVAGQVYDVGSGRFGFLYGQSYLQRSDVIPLWGLPLGESPYQSNLAPAPPSILDALPDSWGQRVLRYRASLNNEPTGDLIWMLLQGSQDRIGALEFHPSSTKRSGTTGDFKLEDLIEAAALIDSGELPSASLPPDVATALRQGSSDAVGGARPKSLTRRELIKFSRSTDTYPVERAEFVAMRLAADVGLNVCNVDFKEIVGRDALIVQRFDRPGPGRRLLVTALSILNLHDETDGMSAARLASYANLADHIRAAFTNPEATLRELFGRIAFNICVGNTDDYARNHAAFWDGKLLELTPAYDVCPQSRVTGEASQAMSYGPSDRKSSLSTLSDNAGIYGLTKADALDLIVQMVGTIESNFDRHADEVKLPSAARAALWKSTFLNPSIFY